jgi:hypothetical protein
MRWYHEHSGPEWGSRRRTESSENSETLFWLPPGTHIHTCVPSNPKYTHACPNLGTFNSLRMGETHSIGTGPGRCGCGAEMTVVASAKEPKTAGQAIKDGWRIF